MSYKILLADDSVTVQKIVTLTFSDEGVEVVPANTGDAAVMRLQYLRPALIMADVSIPGKNGYEICEYVKSHPELKQIPVILLVPAFEPFDEERAARVGADHHLTKPFQSIRTLIATVKQLIEHGSQPAPATLIDGLEWPATQPPVTAVPASRAAANEWATTQPLLAAVNHADRSDNFELQLDLPAAPVADEEGFDLLEDVWSETPLPAAPAPADDLLSDVSEPMPVAAEVEPELALEEPALTNNTVELPDVPPFPDEAATATLLPADLFDDVLDLDDLFPTTLPAVTEATLVQSATTVAVLEAAAPPAEPLVPTPVISPAAIDEIVERVVARLLETLPEQLTAQLVRHLSPHISNEVADQLRRQHVAENAAYREPAPLLDIDEL